MASVLCGAKKLQFWNYQGHPTVLDIAENVIFKIQNSIEYISW